MPIAHAMPHAIADAHDERVVLGRKARVERIVIVFHDFSTGGTEHVAIRMANVWAQAGRQITIFCGTEAGPLRAMVAPDVMVVRAPREYRRSPPSRLRLADALAAFVAANPADVVFAPGNFHLPVLTRFKSLDRSGTVTVGKLSNPLASHRASPARAVSVALQRWALRRIDHLIAMSPALRAEATKILGGDRIAQAWEPLLTDSRFAHAPSASPMFIAIGRLERQKRFALAIEALALSAAPCRPTLLILGEGSERLALERLAERLGIADRVTFGGYRKHVAPDLVRATALLMPSRFEGYPAVAVEAIAAGVPVLATDCSPAIDEILSHDNRSRVVAAQPAAFAAAMDAVLTTPASPPTGADILRARHEVTTAARDYLDLLDRIVGNATPGR